MLPWLFLGLIGFVVILFAINAITKRFKVRDALPVAPGTTIQDIWDLCMEHKDQLQEKGVGTVVELLRTKFHQQDIEGIRKELIELEKESSVAKNPLEPLRRAIMKEVDDQYLSELIFNLDADYQNKLWDRLKLDMQLELLGFTVLKSKLKTYVLRLYTFGKFGDGAENDWFVFYCKAAKIFAGNTVAMFKEAAIEESGSFYATLGKHYEPMMSRLRESIVKIPPKTPVPWSEDS